MFSFEVLLDNLMNILFGLVLTVGILLVLRIIYAIIINWDKNWFDD